MKIVRKILVSLIVVLVMGSGVGESIGIGTFGSSEVEAASVKKGTVTVNGLNMRAGVGVHTKRVMLLRKGNVVDVKGTYKRGSVTWYKVTYGKKTGYVSGQYLKVRTVPVAVKKTATKKPVVVAKMSTKVLYKATVTTSRLNVRSTTSTKGKAVGQVKKGQTYNVYEVKKVGSITWNRILYRGKWAYVSGSFMKKVVPVKKPVVAPKPVAPKPVTPKPVAPKPVAPKPVTPKPVVTKPTTGVKNDGGTVTKPVEETKLSRILTGTVSTDGLNVRRWPSDTSAIVGKLGRGAIIQIVGTNVVDGATWYKFEYQGAYAFVHSGYVSVVKYGSTPAKLPSTGGTALSGEVVVLDAGHGGSDPGAVANGVYEKELVFDVTKRVERLLKADGATVLLTRSTDVYPSLDDRVKFANSRNADLFVSVHANSAAASARGIETFYSSRNLGSAAKSRELALEIQRNMVASTGAVNRGVKTADYYVIRNTRMPAVLLELGFITNAQEASKLKTSAYRETLAIAIYRGIVAYTK